MCSYGRLRVNILKNQTHCLQPMCLMHHCPSLGVHMEHRIFLILLLLPDLHIHLFPSLSFSWSICLTNLLLSTSSTAVMLLVVPITFCSTLEVTVDDACVITSFSPGFTLECKLVAA